MYKLIMMIAVFVGMYFSIANYIKSNEDKPNIEAIRLQSELNALKAKKNTLMLIILEQRNKSQNKKRLDSLDVSYYLD